MNILITAEALTALEQAAIAEHEAWRARLELERWTTSDRDPDLALKELIRTEGTPTRNRRRFP